MSTEYRIAETDTFIKSIAKPELRRLYEKITTYIYPQLRKNPFFGPNIKRLRGELSSYYRYRVGDYRLIYRIDNDKLLVFILDLRHRKDAY